MQCNDRLLEIAPDCEWVHMQRGQFLATFEPERVEEGTRWVERSLSLAPDSAGIHLEAAEFFSAGGTTSGALEPTWPVPWQSIRRARRLARGTTTCGSTGTGWLGSYACR